MFNRAIAGQPLPKRVSTDHDPLFRFHRWLANLRVLAIEEVKSVPYAPVSHNAKKKMGKVRHGMPDFPNSAARVGRAFSWPYFWTVTIAVCVNMA
jgi:hypothetical protein